MGESASAANAASSVGSAASNTGSMAGGAIQGLDAGQGVASATPAVSGVSDVAGGAAQSPSWWDTITKAVNDYGEGSKGGFGQFVSNVKDGNYMKAGGYLGDKISSMGGAPPQPVQVNLPRGDQQQQDPMNAYAALYAKYRRGF